MVSTGLYTGEKLNRTQNVAPTTSNKSPRDPGRTSSWPEARLLFNTACGIKSTVATKKRLCLLV